MIMVLTETTRKLELVEKHIQKFLKKKIKKQRKLNKMSFSDKEIDMPCYLKK